MGTGAVVGAGAFQKTSHTLESDFTLEKGQEDVVCVDLEGEWSESSKIFRHPDFKNNKIEYICGEVGEGGDHMNLTFKNISEETITIKGDEIVIFISEDPDEKDPNLSDQKQSEEAKQQQEKEKEEKEKREQKDKEEKERREKEEREKKELEAKVQKEKEEKDKIERDPNLSDKKQSEKKKS